VRPGTLLVVLVAAATLAGCGGGGSAEAEEPLPVQPPHLTDEPEPAAVSVTAQTPYTRALEQLCVRALREHEAIGPAESPEELEKTLPKTAAVDRRFLRDLQALEPKPSAAELRRAGRLVYLVAAYSDIQDSALLHLTAGNPNGFFQFMEQSNAARKEADKVARQLGAPACAVRPFASD
jgi:hypothetical protein